MTSQTLECTENACHWTREEIDQSEVTSNDQSDTGVYRERLPLDEGGNRPVTK